MRLDHLLSKEHLSPHVIQACVCFVVVASLNAVCVFAGGSWVERLMIDWDCFWMLFSTLHFFCGVGTGCLVFGSGCWCILLGFWETGARFFWFGFLALLLVAAGLMVVAGWVCGYVGNYTVDASICSDASFMDAAIFCCGVCFVCVVVILNFFYGLEMDAATFCCGVCFVILFCLQVLKSERWMPWHLEPKKDVVICDKPRGVDKRAVIRGFPNGETQHATLCLCVTPV